MAVKEGLVVKEKLAVLGGPPAMPEGIERTRWPRYSEEELEELCRVLREEQVGGSDAPQVVGLERSGRSGWASTTVPLSAPAPMPCTWPCGPRA